MIYEKILRMNEFIIRDPSQEEMLDSLKVLFNAFGRPIPDNLMQQAFKEILNIFMPKDIKILTSLAPQDDKTLTFETASPKVTFPEGNSYESARKALPSYTNVS